MLKERDSYGFDVFSPNFFRFSAVVLMGDYSSYSLFTGISNPIVKAFYSDKLLGVVQETCFFNLCTSNEPSY